MEIWKNSIANTKKAIFVIEKSQKNLLADSRIRTHSFSMSIFVHFSLNEVQNWPYFGP